MSEATPHQYTVIVPASLPMVALLGPRDEFLAIIEREFAADVHARGNTITVVGDPAEAALVERLLDELVTMIRTGQGLTAEMVERSIGMLRTETRERPAEVLSLNILSNRGRTIRPKTLNQKRYVDAIDKHTVVFGIGPAGTGKTYLAMAKAVQALQAKEVNRIILTRPAVEAGERLGFLPGTLSEKIDPYLRPLYDALHDMLDPETIPKLLTAGTIEVAPLAYMRGRTLNDAFIILDEAQNTSPEQMKMFLTRLGFGSKMVVTGDVTQVDLPDGTRSGLKVVRDILTEVGGVHFSLLTAHDVVRHKLVGRIVAAYETYEEQRDRAAGDDSDPPGSAPTTTTVSVEVLDESGADPEVDVAALAGLSRFVLDRMRLHPATEMCLRLVDEPTIEALNRQWMQADGPTDVLAFPIDELTPGRIGEEPPEGYLGDVALCPQVAARQAPEHHHTAADEIDLLCVHGILHLLGFDHAEPDEHRHMFGLQTRLLAEWQGVREGQPLREDIATDGTA